MRTSKVHHCQQQELVALRKAEPPAKPCRCKKVISLEEADDWVSSGIALEAVVARERGVEEVECDMCFGKRDVVNCAKCKGTGKIEVAFVKDTKNLDIVLLRHRSKNVSTPKVPTIESEHIERAYVNGGSQAVTAAARIEEYGLLTLEARAFTGCTHLENYKCYRCARYHGKKVPAIGLEPENNPKTGEGYKYDYGRTI